MNKTKIFLVALLCALMTNVGSTQELISADKTFLFSKEIISSLLSVDAEFDVQVYKVSYTTKSIALELDTASGIFCIPIEENKEFPILLYCHGTVDDRNDVPSKGSSEQYLAVAIASQGYVSVAPDFIGLGSSKGLHPYLHPESEAWASLDLIRAVKEMEGLEGIQLNEKIFVTGYSQGGHAAMATCRALQDVDDLTLTAGAPMSGPYSISKEMKSFTLSNNEYSFCSYLASVLLTAKYVYPELMIDYNVENVFKPEFAVLVRQFEAEEIALFELNDLMKAKLIANEGVVIPNRMFLNEVRNDLDNNPENPIFKALQKMDVDDWKPEAPIKMLYCKSDDQVTYRNAVYTDSLMNTLGAPNVSSEDVLSSGDHGDCVIPATKSMIDFFNSYNNPSAIVEIDTYNNINVWPTLVNGSVNLQLMSDNSNISALVVIRDLNARVLLRQNVLLNSNVTALDLSKLDAGIVFLQVLSKENNIISNNKLIITK